MVNIYKIPRPATFADGIDARRDESSTGPQLRSECIVRRVFSRLGVSRMGQSCAGLFPFYSLLGTNVRYLLKLLNTNLKRVDSRFRPSEPIPIPRFKRNGIADKRHYQMPLADSSKTAHIRT